jgi:5-methylcytosine-specific restriction endonuclease McrA
MNTSTNRGNTYTTVFLEDISIRPALIVFPMPTNLNPYIRSDGAILEKRRRKTYAPRSSESVRTIITRLTGGVCLLCNGSLIQNEEKVELHHIRPLSMGGTWKSDNLAMLHETCHKQATASEEINNLIAHRRKAGRNKEEVDSAQ